MKKETNYTKGKWIAEAVSDDPRSDPRWWILCDEKIILSTVGGNDEANAKLAAAAPDLFEACEEVNKWLIENIPATSRPARIDKMLQDAIAKVNGFKVD